MNHHTFTSKVDKSNSLTLKHEMMATASPTHTNLSESPVLQCHLLDTTNEVPQKACIHMYSTSVCCSYSNPIPNLIQQLNSLENSFALCFRYHLRTQLKRKKNHPNNVKFF